MTRLIEPADVCQVVLANFSRTLREGRGDFPGPDDLLRLLSVMARNELNEQAKKIRRRPSRRPAQRGHRERRSVDLGQHLAQRQAATGRAVRRHLWPVDPRRSGRSPSCALLDHDWATIATILGGTAEGRRERWARVVQRLNLN